MVKAINANRVQVTIFPIHLSPKWLAATSTTSLQSYSISSRLFGYLFPLYCRPSSYSFSLALSVNLKFRGELPPFLDLTVVRISANTANMASVSAWNRVWWCLCNLWFGFVVSCTCNWQWSWYTRLWSQPLTLYVIRQFLCCTLYCIQITPWRRLRTHEGWH